MNLDRFIPHGFCLAWDPGLVALQASSDILIALAYYSIPAALVVFLRRRKDLAFRPIFGLFAAFILACGTTHVLGVITLFAPLYWIDGLVKAFTAALSIATAIMLWPLLPKALALPSPSLLTALNTRLAREIEERDETALRLEDSRQRLRDLYARSPAILHATDAAGVMIEVSQRWLDLFGYERHEVIGRNMKDFYQPGTIGAFPDDLHALQADLRPAPQADLRQTPQADLRPAPQADLRQTPRERRIVLRSGEVRDAEAVYTLENDGNGVLQRILVALTDVTLRKQAEAALRESEERLRHAQKMEAVGQLTGGIAHDFNNLLTSIMASLEMLTTGGRLDARGQRMAGNALEGARRAARLTSQLLSFSRRSRLAPESLDAEATVQGIADLLTQTAGERIRFSICHGQNGGGGAVWPIMADRNQFEAAVLNLVINARDAIDADGEIRIACTNRPLTLDEAGALWPDPLDPGDYVGITVADTGSGMAPEVLVHALEPFFTTKSAGAGTGLGLSQTYGFATQSGGTLRIDTAPGQGTRVEILLPRATDAAIASIAPIPPAALAAPSLRAAASEVIVLAEDDALLRHTMSEVLRSQGYVVETAPDGRAALALLTTLPHVDLLLTDVMMPGGMNGVQLAQAAMVALPDLPVIFATGYSDRNVLAQWPGPIDVLNKPFALDTLARRVTARLHPAV